MNARPVDLLVLGGGIAGLGVARLAARNGLSVALLERGDIAGGASSASSHLLHGGLRYLEHGHLHLVREALIERAAVAGMAPALARPRRFVVPAHRGGMPLWKLRAGLALYDVLAGRRGLAPHSIVRTREALALEPALASTGLAGAGLYSDVVVDDARLSVVVARDATAHGAAIHTYAEVQGARAVAEGRVRIEARDRLEGGAYAFEARVVVNATGPWSDSTRAWLSRSLRPGSPESAPLLRPSRGTHLVYPPLTRGHALLLLARRDGRVWFVVPFAHHSLVGTTEVEVTSPPPADASLPDADEVAYLRAELARALPATASVTPLAAFAGIRPLLAGRGAIGSTSREHRVIADGAVLTLAGGKLTTFRAMARDTLRGVLSRLGRPDREPHDSDDPLPPPIAPGLPLEQVVDFAIDAESARRAEDVVRRRTTLWLEPARARAATPRIVARMAVRLGWDAARMQDETEAALGRCDDLERPLAITREDG